MKKFIFLCLCFTSELCFNAEKSASSKSKTFEQPKNPDDSNYRLNLQRLQTMPFYNPNNENNPNNETLNLERRLNSPRYPAKNSQNS